MTGCKYAVERQIKSTSRTANAYLYLCLFGCKQLLDMTFACLRSVWAAANISCQIPPAKWCDSAAVARDNLLQMTLVGIEHLFSRAVPRAQTYNSKPRDRSQYLLTLWYELSKNSNGILGAYLMVRNRVESRIFSTCTPPFVQKSVRIMPIWVRVLGIRFWRQCDSDFDV